MNDLLLFILEEKENRIIILYWNINCIIIVYTVPTYKQLICKFLVAIGTPVLKDEV